MKIALYNPFVFTLFRGNETITLNLANTWADKGHEVTLIGLNGETKGNEKLSDYVRVKRLKSSRYYRYLAAGVQLAANFIVKDYDLIFVLFPDYGLKMASKFLNLSKTKVILYLGYSVKQSPSQYELIKSYSFWSKQNVHLLAVSASSADMAEKRLELPVGTLPPGINIDRFYPDRNKDQHIKAKYLPDAKTKVLLCGAAFSKSKGIHKVIEMFSLLTKDRKNLILLIAGDGEEKEALHKQIVQLNLADKAIFIGKRDDLEYYYNAADLFISLSKSEASITGLTTMEAMACGCPALFLPCFEAGIEIWSQYACVLENDSPLEVSTKAEAILNGSLKFKDAVSFIRENYSYHAMANKVERLFEEKVKQI